MRRRSSRRVACLLLLTLCPGWAQVIVRDKDQPDPGTTPPVVAPTPAPTVQPQPLPLTPTPAPLPTDTTTQLAPTDLGQQVDPRTLGQAPSGPRMLQYYPPRYRLTDPETDALLGEIEAESEKLVPLFGMGLFRRMILEKAIKFDQAAAIIAAPPPNYRLKPGDKANVTYYNDFVAPVTVLAEVNPDGFVNFDPVGSLPVNGLSTAEFEALVTKEVRRKGPRNATVKIAWTSLHSNRVRVTGEVRRQTGVVLLSGYGTLIDAIASSGGPRPFGSLRHVKVNRGGQVTEYDLYRYLMEGDQSANPQLNDGDAINVPLAEALVTTEGAFKRAWRFELLNEKSVAELVALAGGFVPEARNLQVERVVDGQHTLLLDAPRADALLPRPALAAVEPLRDGDVLRAVYLNTNTANSIIVRGAVLKPGAYGYRRQLTLGEAIKLAQGVTKGAHASTGYIERRRPGAPAELLNFVVADVFDAGPASMLQLSPGDIIVIPAAGGPFEVPRTAIAVHGAVVREGVFDFKPGMTLGDALRLCQGLARTGFAAVGAIQRQRGDGTLEPLNFSVVDVQANGPQASIPLRAGDDITVPKQAKLEDFPDVAISVGGAVEQAGTFAWQPKMTVADAIALAQGLSSRGYGPGGSVNRLQPDGQMATLPFALASVLAGGPDAKLALKPGDVVTIQLPADRSPVSVTINGAVNKPGAIGLVGVKTVADLLLLAGGLKADAALGRASVQSLVDGKVIDTTLDLTEVPRGGLPRPNPVLRNGDVVRVPSLADVGGTPMVKIAGPVRLEGAQRLTDGMTVADLIQRAGGLLLRTGRRALLVRVVPGTPDTQKFFIDVDKALALDAKDNLKLQEDDALTLYPAGDELFVQRTVTISGPVGRAGVFPRAVGMRLSDLIREGGWLKVGADPEEARLVRLTERGTVRTLLVNPSAAIKGVAAADLELVDGDLLEVQPLPELTFRKPQVSSTGALYQPGSFPLTEQMTVEDLLWNSKGPTPDAFLPRAELVRRTADGGHRVIPVDLRKRPNLMPLERDDRLDVYTLDRAVYREATVDIKGFVQRPNTYERTEGMTLKDLLFQSGGVVRDPTFLQVEVARARDVHITVFGPDIQKLLKGDERQNLVLADHDVVHVRSVGIYNPIASEVLVKGEVGIEGSFAIQDDEESLRHLLERCDGLRKTAFPEGAALLRKVEQIAGAEQARYASDVYRQLQAVRNKEEYLIMFSQSLSLKTQGGGVAGGAELPKLPNTALPLPTSVVPGSDIKDREQYVRLAVNLQDVLAGKFDLTLRASDVLVVPKTPQSILVQGEVKSQFAVPYVPGQTVASYIAAAGGFTGQADAESLLIIRANGVVVECKARTVVQRGDILIVPPKAVQLPQSNVEKIGRWQAIGTMFGSIATTLLAISNVVK